MKILAVTACPTGIAHTYMAAEALEREAKARGYDIKVETQGSIGIENKITSDDLVGANVVIITKDMAIKGKDRFKDIPIVNVDIGDVIKKTGPLLDMIVKKISED
ncbi:PTS fructose-like transporter subunit IIB [Anaerosalibacter massiliensis]|uniref:PTS fructose-like transporter subunit IIB n=1 Tax=Anaerosalibacter massiliensis TaxID=1347392 RepID=A0A9X2MI71_9FIRM|nr:PTS fructose-like transporter subunit IIB [Anaerosalibacter massiliensis]MCR2045622.1 PTS fructose-like transporter subunit IIB [Anaerosalibacter massiliensis]